MELFLQYGWGMKGHCTSLIKIWEKGTVILSPRDIERDKIASISREIRNAGGEVWFDPQIYDPRANHHRLTMYEYWPKTYATNMFDDSYIDKLLQSIDVINQECGSSVFILPGISCSKVNRDWLRIHGKIAERAAIKLKNHLRAATICLSGETIRSEDQLEEILIEVEKWPVDIVYLVPAHPKPQYLVEDPLWLGNLLSFCAGLKIIGKKVFVGYASHQMLLLATANVDAIGAGTWLNVRSFSTDKFNNPDADKVSRRSKWYYCPQALSEYKIIFLDLAHRLGVLDQLESKYPGDPGYASSLFSGAQPSLANFDEQSAFRHYLNTLHYQCSVATRPSFSETLNAQSVALESARRLLEFLQSKGIRGQDRDFGSIIDINLGALSVLEMTRGFALSRSWKV